jgi:hypothetical protein
MAGPDKPVFHANQEIGSSTHDGPIALEIAEESKGLLEGPG